MDTPAPHAADTLPSSVPTVARTVVLLTALISVLLTAFAWPSVRSHVHDAPIAVAGPPAAVKQVSAALDQRLPGGFAITEVADTSAAERLIRDREVYGAVDVSSGAPQVITASAAGAAVAQTLQGVAVGLGQAQAQGVGKKPSVRDIARQAAGALTFAITGAWLRQRSCSSGSAHWTVPTWSTPARLPWPSPLQP
ncbi:hypothetical protein QBA35_36845 [Streptomyces bottropensis]|uniref:Uncharacterized protein n=1 Tax=Streptomyces bottropensis TaxID=42235 RepID=A0ABU8AYL2_9ACTN